MFCPNFLNKDVFDGFNEMIEALGGKPMTAEEFRSSELRNLRTGPDFAAMETAYKLYHLNGGKFLDFAPNGEPSLLFASILDSTKDYKLAVAIKADFYSQAFTDEYGNWIEGAQNEESKFDINGEPILGEFVNNQGVRFDIQKEMDEIKAKAIADGTFMKAPNGKPTNLTERQWLQVRTKNFINWFGDWINDPGNASKVVDENGEPLVVYHGTQNKWNVFDPDKIGSATDDGYYGRGLYLSSLKNKADEYNRGENGQTMPLFVNMKNPFYVGLDEHLDLDEATRRGEIVDKFNRKDLPEELKLYDGVLYTGGDARYEEIVIKDPNLIKSAINNNGLFSTKNNDINAYPIINSELIVTENEYTKEFRKLQERSNGLVPETISKYHREGLRGRDGDSFKERLGRIYERLLSKGYNSSVGSWSVTSDKHNLTFTLRKVNGNLFHDIFKINRNYLENGELVDLHNNYDNCKCFLSSDGLCGFAIEDDGNLVSVFSLNPSYKRGFLYAIKDFIMELGATHLDAYASKNQNLEEIYKKTLLFYVASEMDYNMEYDHDNIAKNHGTPKVVFMVNHATERQYFNKDQYNEAVNHVLSEIRKPLYNKAEEQKAVKKYGFDVKFKPVSSTNTFGESIARRLESGQTVSSSEIISLFTERNYFSESNKTLAEIVVRHDIPVIFAPLEGALMTTRTDENGGSYVIIDLTNLQDVSNNFFSDKFLHEVVHALSVGTINNPKTSEESALVALNKNLFDTFSKLFPKEKYSRSTYLYYGLTNEKEFLAEFTTNSEFRDALYAKITEQQSKGLLNKIKSFINRISNLFINRDIFRNETKEQLKKLENDFKKYLLNIETVEKGNITDEAVLNALYNNIDDETSFNDLVAIAQDQLARSIENWDSNNFLLLPVTPTSGVNRIKTEQEIKREIEKKSKEIAESLSKRLAAILSSNLSADEKLKHQLQLLAQITQFRDYSENFYKNLTMFIIPLSAQLLEDSKQISRIRINLSTISDSEYMYQAHANFGVYQKILEELKNLLDEPSTLTILQEEIQNDPLGNNDVKNNIEMLIKRIEESALVANSALAKTKKILISNLKQKFSDYAAKYNFIDLVDYIDELENINYDTSKFFNFVGSIDAAKDPGLRMLHTLVYNAITTADRQTHEKSTTLLKLQKNLKPGESVKDLYEHNKLGLTTGYLIRKYNYGQMYQDYDDFLKKLNAECGLDLDNRIAPNDDDTRRIWNQKRNKWLSEHVERKYKPEYYEIFSNLSYETLKARSQVQNEINAIKEKCKDKDGYYHFEDLSDKDWETLQSLYTTRRWLTSEFRIDGTKKDGVELKIAQELQALNKALGEHRSINKDVERWKKDRAKIIEKAGGMEKFKAQSDDFDWDMLAKWDERNSVTRLKINEETGRSILAEFIDDLIDYDVVYNLIDEEHPNGDNGETYENLKKDYYKLLNTARTSSGNINPFNLSEGAKKKILEIASEMARIKKQAKKHNKLLRDVLKRKARLWRKYTYSEKTPLYKRLFAAAIKRDKVEPGYLDKFKRATGTYHFDDIDEETISFTPHEWYRKTFAREEYWDDYMEVVPGDSYVNYDDDQDSFLNPEFDEKENSAWIPKKGIKRYDNSKNYDKVINSPTLSALYREVEKTIVESNEKMPNLRYHDNYLLPQITGSFYKKLSGARLPQNASKWQKIKNYVKYGAKGIGEDYFGRTEGDETDYGESVDDFMNRLNIDELGNILNNKSMSISNKVSGVMPDDRQLNIIPQYYTRKLKDPSLISYDLIGITCEYYNNACKFEQKSKIKDECESIVDMMENRKYNTKWHFLKPIKVLKSEDGSKSITTQKLISKLPKTGKQSNTYNAAKKFLEMNLYNLRGGDPIKFGNWNISKLGATFRAFAVAMNLGMSPVVAAVGYFTSILNHTIHAIVGQKYDYASAFSASYTVLFHALKNIGDIGNTVSKDKLMCLAEHFNLSGQGKKKYKHSNRMRAINAVNNNWCFGFLTMFDYIAKSNVMVSTLMTYRFVDGLFITKEDIKRNGWNKSKEEVKQLLLKWKSGKSLYSCLKADKEGNIICEEEFKSAYKKVEDVLHARIEKTAEAVDGMATETQKAAVTTQFLGACVLMHRQYFPLMLLERLGHTVFDPDQQQYIHGEFRTLGRLFKLFLYDGWKETSMKNVSKQSMISGAAVGAMSGSVFGPLGSIIGAGAGSIIGALKSSSFDNMFGISTNYKLKYNELSETYENMLNLNITPEQKQIIHREMEKDISELYSDALNSITFNYHRRRIIAEFLMYKLLVIPIVSLIAGWADDDKDNLLAQLLAYIGHRTQWEFFTPYRLDDSLNNFKSTSAATGLLDRLQNFGGQLIYSIFPRGGLFDTFFDKNKKEGDNYILRGVYSKYPFAPFSGFDGKWDRFELSLFKLLPIHNLYEQIYDSKQKDRYYTNQIMHLED